MGKFYVYTITSMDSGEVLYVGKGSGFRWKTSLKRIEELSGSSMSEFYVYATYNYQLSLRKNNVRKD